MSAEPRADQVERWQEIQVMRGYHRAWQERGDENELATLVDHFPWDLAFDLLTADISEGSAT